MSRDILDRAICFAVEAHSGMVRKLGNSPYILHPLEAVAIAGTLTEDREILAAMVLHDVVEDTSATLAEIEGRFGLRVAALVGSETENKRRGQSPSATWMLRKEESLRRLRAADDIAVKILWMGDKLSNIRSIHAAFLREGPAIWEHFNQKDPARQAWYYRSVARALRDLEDSSAWREYNRKVEEVFAGVPELDEGGGGA